MNIVKKIVTLLSLSLLVSCSTPNVGGESIPAAGSTDQTGISIYPKHNMV